MNHPLAAGSHKPFWVKPIYLVLATILLLGIAIVTITALQNRSVREYRTAVETEELALQSFHMFTASWRAVISNQPSTANAELAPAAFEADVSIELLLKAIESYEAVLAKGHESNLRDEIIAFSGFARQSLALIQDGQPDAALGVMVAANDVYYPLSERVAQSTDSYSKSAEETRKLTLLASAAVIASAFIVGVLVYWRYRESQRKTEQAAAEQEIWRRSEARFRPLIQSASDVIAIVDSDGIIKYISPSVTRLSKSAPRDFVGESMMLFVRGEDARQLRSLLLEVSERPGYTQAAELQVQSRYGTDHTLYVQVICTNCMDDPDVNGLVLNIRDISERKELEDQLRHQAFHDSLTGLANRLRFLDRLSYALERGKRAGGKPVSVLYLDLDYFKNVNDEMGHAAGDSLLQLVAERVKGCIRSTDTAARLGGDEFAILLEDLHTVDGARAVAEDILQELKLPFHIRDREVHASASVGVVVADPNLLSAEEVIRNADVAMYDAKENGRGGIQFFEPDMQLSLVERIGLTNDLNGSIDHGELEVHYQPLLLLVSQRIVGFEALVRWRHQSRGLLQPAQFIGLAEDSGFIHDLGHFVLFEACRQGHAWKGEYPDADGLTMSVNVSAHQLQKPGFVQEVERVLKNTGFNPGMLVLEITESVLIRHPEEVIGTLQELKALGVHLALDDFGTGYSSLSYLKRFPIDILKIDRSFIEGMNETDRDMMLVQTVIDLGHTLKLDIVAEGIERSEQLKSLQALDCALGQGYLFAKPLDASSAEAMLRDQAAGPSLPSRDGGGSGKEIRVA
ncbi:MAG TPA: EAL domain-containing protein [Dehalococcoidia bacterium]|nr:EAL domain-containing protein [Dehalococcoidia bacterium]